MVSQCLETINLDAAFDVNSMVGIRNSQGKVSGPNLFTQPTGMSVPSLSDGLRVFPKKSHSSKNVLCMGGLKRRSDLVVGVETFNPKKMRKGSFTVESRNRRVRFEEAPKLYTIPAASGNDTWHSRKELMDMKRSAKRECMINIDAELDACYISSGMPSDESARLLVESPNFQAQRGLERWTSINHYRSRIFHLLACKTTVFIEQSEQMVKGEKNEEKLADLCRKSSAKSVRFAIVLGKVDKLAL